MSTPSVYVMCLGPGGDKPRHYIPNNFVRVVALEPGGDKPRHYISTRNQQDLI